MLWHYSKEIITGRRVGSSGLTLNSNCWQVDQTPPRHWPEGHHMTVTTSLSFICPHLLEIPLRKKKKREN
jgi:hypothetical protein